MTIRKLTEIRAGSLTRQREVNVVCCQESAYLLTLQKIQADSEVRNEVAPQVRRGRFCRLIGAQTGLFVGGNLIVVEHRIKEFRSIVVHEVVVYGAYVFIFFRHILTDKTAKNKSGQQRFRSVLVDTLRFCIHDV